jgi:uncharacterized protein (TIGR02301 family)
MRRVALSLGLALVAAPALAQTSAPPSAAPPLASSPQQHQMVVDLAYVLGEEHALHRLCAGAEDNTWRGRMGRLLKAEAPDPAYRQQLMNSFNAGFTAERAEFTTCTLASADRERIVAAKGRDISRRLADGVSP